MKTYFQTILVVIVCSCANLFAQTEQQMDNFAAMADLTAITVTIGGDFVLEGSYPSSTVERLDPFITRMYNEGNALMLSALRNTEALADYKRSKKDQYAKRNIKLMRKDGSEQVIDLARFRLDADFTNNPYLKDGDVIIFPPLDLERNFISIDGAVNKPTKIQYVEGDNLQDALFFARGLNAAYQNIEKAEITRLGFNGENEEIFIAKIDEEFSLLPGDRIRVLANEMKRRDYKVLVLGEVTKPGYIPITNNSTTLKEVLEKAGGFTPNASLKFSELIRSNTTKEVLRGEALRELYPELMLNTENRPAETNDQLLERLRMMRSANLKLEDTLYFGIDNQLRVINGISALDFRNLETDTSFESNYIVKDKDIIVVPEKQRKVYVWGGVKEAGYYEYIPGYTIADYLKTAGSFSEVAFGDDEVYLIKGKSYDWIEVDFDEDYEVEPGDFIYAKKDPPMSFDFYLERIGSIAAIVGSLASTILLLISIR